MFRYLVYWVTDPGLKHFDPQTDLLLSRTDYYVWRHVAQNQDLLRVSKPMCGAIHQRGDWMIMPVMPGLDTIQVQRWLDEQLRRAPGDNLGMNGWSDFHSLLRPLPPEDAYVEYDKRFALVNAFIRTYLPGFEELGYETPLNPEMAWKEDKDQFVSHLLDQTRQPVVA